MQDIYTEPNPIDVNTLKNLGPLALMAGVWQGTRGLDVKPKAEGAKKQAYVENITLQPIDPQTNGPQLLYGLRYHTHITKPNNVKTYHDQVGYWLWEPATQTIIHTLTIPRGQIVMAVGKAAPDARTFELIATNDGVNFGIRSAPFIEDNFKTVEFRITVTINDDGTWGYAQDTVMMIKGTGEPFHHTDKNVLHKVADATPNPLRRHDFEK